MKKLAYLFIFTACLATGLMAQDISGTIGGTVMDPTGSAVPKAKVSITNTDRKQVVRTVTTDATGTYSAPVIPIGNYSLKIEAAGFKTNEVTGIVLNVNDDLKFNLKLEVGAITETVEVTEAAIQVETGSATNATTISGDQVRDLQLGTRNYEQLVALMPGVVANTTDELYIGNSAPSGMAATIPFSINGLRNSSGNWTVDGADNVDRGSNQTLITFPSVDSIDQFKVERSLYTADTGRAGGAQINVVTRSGSSQFHGAAFEFLRNDAIAANNWSNNANKVNVIDGKATVPPLRWNNFGYNIGGPVYIPGKYNKDRNKTFFFFTQEWRKIITYTTLNPTLATQGMMNGTFSQPVCLSAVTGGCPTGSAPVTQIPANLINPIAAEYIKDIFSKLPLSATNSVAATTSGFFPVRNIYNGEQEIVKIDHRFTDKYAVFGKFENDGIPTTEPGGLFTGSAIPLVATTNTNSPGKIFVFHFSGIFKPTLVNEAGFNFSKSAILSKPAGLMSKANSPDVSVPEPFANTQGIIPELTFTSGSSLLGYGPYNEYNRNYSWFDTLTWIKGRHTARFGITVNRYNKTENAANQEGTFGFTNSGVPTGSTSFQQSWANFLLGNVANFSMPSQDITPNLWAWQTEAFAQDDFKIIPRLTLSIGARYSFFGQPTDSNGMLSNFDPALYSAAAAPKIDPTTGNMVAGTYTAPYTNGIIIAGKNSPFGSHVAPQKLANVAPRIGIAWDPFGDGKTAIRSGYGIFYDSTLFGTYEQNIFANPPFVQSISLSNASFSNIAGGTTNVSLSPVAPYSTQLPALIPYVQQWSFDVQRQVQGGVVVDIGYVGTKGTHLLGYLDLNEAYPGAALAAGLHQANGNTIFTSTDEPRINAVRPYQGYTYFHSVEAAFDSNYSALQISARKSFRSGGTIGLSYTWSKVLTDNSSDRSNAAQNTYNYHEGEYGPASFNRTQVLTFNYVYQLPFLRGNHSIFGRTLGGWQLSGIVTTYTGLPATVTTSSVDPAGLGIAGNSSPASIRPDMTCNPQDNAPRMFNGVTSVGGPTWFNTTCFQATPQGAVRPGNAGRYTAYGPGYFNWDASLVKKFALSKGERVKMELRGEAFNVMNWVNPSGFASTNITSTVFGEISSFRAARRMQLAAKIMF